MARHSRGDYTQKAQEWSSPFPGFYSRGLLFFRAFILPGFRSAEFLRRPMASGRSHPASLALAERTFSSIVLNSGTPAVARASWCACCELHCREPGVFAAEGCGTASTAGAPQISGSASGVPRFPCGSVRVAAGQAGAY